MFLAQQTQQQQQQQQLPANVYVAQPQKILRLVLTELRSSTTTCATFCRVADKAARIVLAHALDLVECKFAEEVVSDNATCVWPLDDTHCILWTCKVAMVCIALTIDGVSDPYEACACDMHCRIYGYFVDFFMYSL